ncbi:hypothetical protein PFISCL1PPCAC_27564, partial [Pristionchus fissidentatus]
QIELLERLDLFNTAILIASGTVTFPPAIFVYIRILTLQEFKVQYITRLFVLNGMANFLIYVDNLAQKHFVDWPSTYFIYEWIRETPFPLFFRFLQDFSYCLMWQSTFYILLNRYLTLRVSGMMKRNERRFFLIATISSILIATIVAFPLFFSGFTYQEIIIDDGQIAHVSEYAEDHYLQIPGAYHKTFVSFATFVVSILLISKCKAVRDDIGSSNVKVKAEHGEITFINEKLIYLYRIYHYTLVQYTRNLYVGCFIPFFLALSTTAPFWVLMGFAHSLR